MIKFLIFIIGNTFGYLTIKNTRQIVQITGRISWAERKLGGGGTYTFIKLMGLLMISLSFLYATGLLQPIVQGIFSVFIPS